MSRKELLEEIRRCDSCTEVEKGPTPVVFSADDPKILIVSEVPPLTEWKKGLGDKWRDSLVIPVGEDYTSANLLKWLSTEESKFTAEDAERLFFWIQRANCHISGDERFTVYKRCSDKYIQRAIDVVKPQIIISLGAQAFWWFFPRKTLTEVVGNNDYRIYEGYNYFALAHPSPLNKSWRKRHRDKHDQSLELVRPFVRELRR